MRVHYCLFTVASLGHLNTLTKGVCVLFVYKIPFPSQALLCICSKNSEADEYNELPLHFFEDKLALPPFFTLMVAKHLLITTSTSFFLPSASIIHNLIGKLVYTFDDIIYGSVGILFKHFLVNSHITSIAKLLLYA